METKELVKVKLKLIDVFLLEMPDNIIDISYNYDINKLDIQIVLLKDTLLNYKYENILHKLFSNHIIKIEIVFVTRDTYNKNVGGWLPSGYKWLDNILYSKAEIL